MVWSFTIQFFPPGFLFAFINVDLFFEYFEKTGKLMDFLKLNNKNKMAINSNKYKPHKQTKLRCNKRVKTKSS